MISTLRNFDKVVAAGILARAALALDDQFNPASTPIVPNETNVRAELLAAMRKLHGIDENDNSPETRERLSDFLDIESDSLLGSTDSSSVLSRLSVKGELPSDLYDVQIIPNIVNFFGPKFSKEKALIEKTVRAPDREQHYGPAAGNNPFMISLFARTFENKYQGRSFIMLVVGERHNLNFIVHQAWRLYPDKVDVRDADDLIDMLRRFANVYGVELEVGNQRGRFIVLADIPVGEKIPDTIRYKASENKKPRLVTVSYFFQRNPAAGHNQAALAVGIDLDRYRDTLKLFGW